MCRRCVGGVLDVSVGLVVWVTVNVCHVVLAKCVGMCWPMTWVMVAESEQCSCVG